MTFHHTGYRKRTWTFVYHVGTIFGWSGPWWCLFFRALWKRICFAVLFRRPAWWTKYYKVSHYSLKTFVLKLYKILCTRLSNFKKQNEKTMITQNNNNEGKRTLKSHYIDTLILLFKYVHIYTYFHSQSVSSMIPASIRFLTDIIDEWLQCGNMTKNTYLHWGIIKLIYSSNAQKKV